MLNLGYPYYFYGVTTLSAKDVVVSGFDDLANRGRLPTTQTFIFGRWRGRQERRVASRPFSTLGPGRIH